jgi:adenosylhomocysteinase
MKHQAIVGNIGHFGHKIDMAGLARVPGIERINTNQVIAQIGLYGHTDIYEKRVYTLPKHLDEKIARLHLDALGPS